MSRFYLPLSLGRPSSRHHEDAEYRRVHAHEAWREGARGPRKEIESTPEESVRQALLRPAAPGYVLITGEPGAGKSTLLEEWLSRWAGECHSPQLGMPVPVLVRFRSLNAQAVALRASPTETDLAHMVWQARLRPEPELAARLEPFHGRDARLWSPVWLLDGLDEAVPELRDEDFLRRLANLPGRVCLSCRTAIAQSLHAQLQPGLAPNGQLDIQPLDEHEQRQILEEHLGNEASAVVLHGRVASNAQMREMAGNPLLLSLIALVGETLDLPASRVAFYERAISRLWLKVTPDSLADDLRSERDQVLTALAQAIGLAEIEFGLDRLDAALKVVGPRSTDLRGALVAAGLLRLERESSRAAFLHLTFQEYFLARALLCRPFAEVLTEYWALPRYEEVLAILLAMQATKSPDMVDAALMGLVEWGLATHRRNPHILWKLGRGPLRLVLHLVARSGVELGQFPRLMDQASSALRDSEPFQIAVAEDYGMPPELLYQLINHGDFVIRWMLAGNPSLPAALLRNLANDADGQVRDRAARNPSTPPDVLSALIADEDADVRCAAAANKFLPVGLAIQIAESTDPKMRGRAAAHPLFPMSIIRKLADDKDDFVRFSVVHNKSLPADLCFKLASDRSSMVLMAVAVLTEIHPEILSIYSQSSIDFLRWMSSENPSLPADNFDRLASDESDLVRLGIGRNPSVPLAFLRRHGRGQDVELALGISENKSTPPDVLYCLMTHATKTVRANVAAHPSATPDILRSLMNDAEAWVRSGIASNPSTPPDLLAQLSLDPDEDVRDSVAGNLATPLRYLANCLVDTSEKVRRTAIENPSLLLEDLLVESDIGHGRSALVWEAAGTDERR